ncbi:unnamed protein product [Caenorhabditis sp. 36 PRJEB53466]|nr:unnamed protein product [Caenorhabditis sp. 36 PRJEB53466]
MSLIRQARYENELRRCYCTRTDCDNTCDVAKFCEKIADRILKDSFMKDVEIAFVEQDTISGVLRGAHGDYCEMFSDNAIEMDAHMRFIKDSVFRATVVMQFIYNCTMGVFKSCQNRMLHQFLVDPCGRIIPENGDFVFRIITNPRFNFKNLLLSSLRILNYEIQRIEFTRVCIHEFVQFLELQLPQVETANQNLANKVVVENRYDLQKASKQHNFLWKTYQVWHNKNRQFLLTTERLMACNLCKLIRMRDMHVAVLSNWRDFSVIPDYLHPRHFESLFFKL